MRSCDLENKYGQESFVKLLFFSWPKVCPFRGWGQAMLCAYVYGHTKKCLGASLHMCPHNSQLAMGAPTEEDELGALAMDPRRGGYGILFYFRKTNRSLYNHFNSANWKQGCSISLNCISFPLKLCKETLPILTEHNTVE